MIKFLDGPAAGVMTGEVLKTNEQPSTIDAAVSPAESERNHA